MKIARSLSAFANHSGGSLLIGVKDNGAIAGVRNEEDIYVVEQAAELYCRPAQHLEFTALRADEGLLPCGRRKHRGRPSDGQRLAPKIRPRAPKPHAHRRSARHHRPPAAPGSFQPTAYSSQRPHIPGLCPRDSDHSGCHGHPHLHLSPSHPSLPHQPSRLIIGKLSDKSDKSDRSDMSFEVDMSGRASLLGLA